MSKTKGFTLVELLVVIAIIALLMSILLPSLARAKKQAMAVLCQSNLKQWGTCFSMYAGDNDSIFMSGWIQQNILPEPWKHTWIEALRPYYGNEGDLRCCPAATKPGTMVNKGPYGGAGPFIAWGIFEGENCGQPWGWNWVVTCDYGSYGGNGFVYNPPPQVEQIHEGGWTKNNWRTANVKGGANIPLFLDAQWWDGWPLETDSPPPYDGAHWTGPDQMNRFCLNRHDGFVNSAFLDYSVRKVGLKQLWKLKWHRSFDVNEGPAKDEWPEWMKGFKDY